MCFVQFEIWQDCKHNCPFCTHRGIPKARNKVESLEYVYQNIDNTNRYDTISLIGGEIFDGQLSDPKVRTEFYKVINLIALKIQKGEVSRGMICTSLMYGDITYLNEFLKFLYDRGVLNRFLISTSWDTHFRFDPPEKEYRWERNMNFIKEYYPSVMVHTQVILTQMFVGSYLDGKFRKKEFENKWGCSVAFNTPFKCWGKYKDKYEMENDLPGFFPSRESFLQLLTTLKSSNSDDIDLNNFLSVNDHSSELHFSFNDKDWTVQKNRHKKGHTCLFDKVCDHTCCGYIDSDKMPHEDVQTFLKSSL